MRRIRAVLSPPGQPVAPQRRLLRGVVLDRNALAPRVVLAHPGSEVLRAQIRESQQQIGQIALGIDHDGRNAVDRRFLQQADTKAGLAAAGHAHADGVRDQVARIV
ncbi:MAG: hypothetical protein Q8N47_19100 [Bryobacterales bacterium]|nr:hypothetical protein [Bryobacterales bacterium]